MSAREGAARLSIGALSRATGVPVETLRTWESRYGFPHAERRPSGHRAYPVSSVARVRRIGEALARGLRAGDVLRASESELERLLATVSPAEEPPPAALPPGATTDEILVMVAALDGERLTRTLLAEHARLGPVGLVETVIAPLAVAAGAAWENGALEVRHEHFLSERVEDLLRSLRLPFDDRARGPRVVAACLPGEQHGLGLQMAALVLAAAGWRVTYLGTDAPLVDIAEGARAVHADAVALSVSSATAGSATAGQVRRLRDRLPRRIAMLVGGAGAQEGPRGVHRFADLRSLDAWARAHAR